MPKWDPGNIKSNDLVMVHIRILRTRCAGGDPLERRDKWDAYRVGLELGQVNLLDRYVP